VRKRLAVLLISAATVVACLPASARPAVQDQQPPPQGEAGPGHRMPLPKIVNLKVLPKNTPAEEVVKIMKGFAGQLGVECKFCHVTDQTTRKLNFASDAKPEKIAARQMMGMTHEINSKYLKELPEMRHEHGEEGDHDEHAEHAEHGEQGEHAARVTCGTCHRGHSHPQAFVPPPEHDREPHNQHVMPPQPQK
jgi:hypothetical protein